MSSIFESQSERPLGPPPDKAEADSHKRAECAERIKRLLSALDGGSSLDPGKTGILSKPVIRESKTDPDPDVSLRFLLVDRTGLIAEFESWDEANQYKKDRQHCGASILSVANKPLEPAAVREQQPTDQPAVSVGGVSPPNGNAIQESKLTGDLGGSHPNTLHADGAKPVISKVMRVAGRFFPAAAKTVTLNACPPILTHRYEMLVLGTSGAQITNAVGLGNLTLTHAPRPANYEAINILYTTEVTNGSKAV